MRIELFKIKKKIELVNYKLKLAKNIKIYLVFYILLLELAPKNSKVVTDIKFKNKKYKVEKVLDL